MTLSYQLDMRQTRSLVMTPLLQQAIKLLQLSNLELCTYVEQELEQNPLLEPEESDGDWGVSESMQEPPAHEEVIFDAGQAPAPSGTAEGAASLDAGYDNGWNHDVDGDTADPQAGLAEAFADWSKSGGRLDFDAPEGTIEQTPARDATLRDHLQSQLTLDVIDPGDQLIGFLLIDLIDGAGRLTGDLGDVAGLIGCPLDRVESVLARLQRFDPVGIFARSLPECLALQLHDRDRLDPAMQILLENLPLVARRDVAALARLCGVDVDDVPDMIAEIRALDPKPGQAFESHPAQAVTPDVIMRPRRGGGWNIELNNETLPRVLINTRYYAQVCQNARSPDEKQYLEDRFRSANWLVKSLHQRATTILKVATEIVLRQDEFFTKGVQHLRPLVLRDVAEAIGMHESTVSRVTAGKYLASPRGNYELKYFFTTAIANANGGDAHSAEAVRYRVKTLIDGEDRDDILSDDRIVDILRKEGVDIARRTVGKYRETFRISSSVQRRREKAAVCGQSW